MGLNNDVEVFNSRYGFERWRVMCAHCECMVVGYETWRDAYSFAREHAAEHESRRCNHCGRTS